MKLSRNAIRARVKHDLPITFSEERISAHGGLELFRRYLVAIDLPGRLRRAVGDAGDYGAARLVLVVIGLLLAGGRRLAHLAVLSRDPMLLRFAGVHRLPADRTVARWMAGAVQTVVEALAALVRDIAHDAIASLALSRLTLDLDGSVLRVCGAAEGAERGFSPHHPKDRSYYPLTAHLAQTGHLLRVWNRPGNVHDSHNAEGFLRTVLQDLRARFGRHPRLEVRLDGAFFHPEILRFLDGEGLDYAVKVPLWKWLGLRERIAARSHWRSVDATVSGFEVTLPIPQWDRVQRVVVYRKRVFHETARNFQLDLFTPDDGHYEYSAIATNLSLGVAALWHFMAGRGGHEKTLGELKQQLAFDAIPSHDLQANALWQQLSVLTHSLVRSFQLFLGAPARPRSRKRTVLFVFRSLQTLRFTLFDQPARIVRPAGPSCGSQSRP
ncbi:MAG TPA: IS1380 family transposase [Myxococcota bacterium]|nr:IS1380 family transposase [Myxococcota bacterium]